MTAPPSIDPAVYRHVLGHYPTGVCAVTGMVDDQPVGMVVGSFTSVSLDPPLVAFMPDRASSTYKVLKHATSFTANILGSSQEEICRRLASKTEVDKWQGIGWRLGAQGAPILDEAVAWIECHEVQTFDGGDHLIVLCRVDDLAVQSDVLPLLFFQGAYGRFSPTSFIARTERGLLAGVGFAEEVRGELEQLSSVTGLETTAAVRIDREIVIVGRAGSTEGSNPRRAVGLRMPFVPPFGGPFSAWDPSAFELWVSQLGSAEGPAAEVLRSQAARVRMRGWSLALRFPQQPVLDDLLVAFTSGEYTPARERELRDLILSVQQYFDPEVLDSAGSYHVYSLRAPVFAADGAVALSVQLIGPDRVVPGSEMERWRDHLLAASERMTAKVTALTATDHG